MKSMREKFGLEVLFIFSQKPDPHRFLIEPLKNPNEFCSRSINDMGLQDLFNEVGKANLIAKISLGHKVILDAISVHVVKVSIN